MRSQKIKLLLVIVLNTIAFIADLVVGYLVGSVALFADSLHMLSDVLSLLVAYYSIELAKKTEATKENSYGFQRAEIVGSLINSIFLLALCFSLLLQVIQRFISISVVSDPKLMLIVGGIGLITNIVGLFLFSDSHSHAHTHSKKKLTPIKDEEFQTIEINTKDESKNIQENKEFVSIDLSKTNLHGDQQTQEAMDIIESEKVNQTWLNRLSSYFYQSQGRGNAKAFLLHTLADVLGSIGVIISAIVMWQTNYKWRFYLDPTISLVIVLLLIYSIIPLARETAIILLQGVPNFNFEALKRSLTNIGDVKGINELHVWRLADNKLIGSAHITILDVQKSIEIGNQAKRIFEAYDVHSSTIQFEFPIVNPEASEIIESVL